MDYKEQGAWAKSTCDNMGVYNADLRRAFEQYVRMSMYGCNEAQLVELFTNPKNFSLIKDLMVVFYNQGLDDFSQRIAESVHVTERLQDL